MKRIAITGTHGVGKTTLSFSIASFFKEQAVLVNSRLARTMIKEGYPLGKEASIESYIQYIVRQLRIEQKASKCDLFISDRTLLDPLSYAVVNNRNHFSAIPESVIALLEATWLLEMKQYDLYVFVPIEFDVQSDGIRPEGEEYRIAVDNQIYHFLNDNNVKYIRVTGSIEERRDQVLQALKQLDIYE